MFASYRVSNFKATYQVVADGCNYTRQLTVKGLKRGASM